MEVVETHRPSWSRGATPLGLDTVPTMEPLPFFTIHLCSTWASLVAQLVKNLPAMWETWDQSLGWENPLEKEQLPTPVFWPGEFCGLYSPWGPKELDMTERL